MKTISQVFTFDLLSKVTPWRPALRFPYMPKMEYAQFTLALSIAVSPFSDFFGHLQYHICRWRSQSRYRWFTAPYLGFQLVAVMVFAILELFSLLHFWVGSMSSLSPS